MKENLKNDRKREKRDRILNEAGKLFITNGYSDTKMIDIAKASGVAKGTLYEYFSSKDEIVSQWTALLVEKYKDRIEPVLASAETPREKLTEYIRFKLDYFQGFLPTLKIIFESHCFDAGKDKHELKREIAASLNLEYLMIRDILIKGVENGSLRTGFDVNMTTSMLFGSMVSYLLSSTDHLREIFCDVIPMESPAYKNTKCSPEAFIDIILNGISNSTN